MARGVESVWDNDRGCPRIPDGTGGTSGTSKTDDCGKKGAARDEGERSLASRIAGWARRELQRRTERISRHFAKCLEVMGYGRRATTFCRMSAGEGAADRVEIEMGLYRRGLCRLSLTLQNRTTVAFYAIRPSSY